MKQKRINMKKLILSAIVSLLCLSLLEAQAVKEAVFTMSQGEKNAFTISIPRIDSKVAATVWKDFMKAYKGKIRFDKKTSEWFTDNGKILEISNNTVDVYAILQEKGRTATDIRVWFDLGGAYLSSKDHPDAAKSAIQMLQGFHLAIEQELAIQLLADEEKKYKAIETDLKQLEKDTESLTKVIEKAQAEIAAAEQKMQDNTQLKEQLNFDLDKQAKSIEATKKDLDKLKRKKIID
jgi:hypothetical protein